MKVRRHERVVHDEADFLAARNGTDGRQIAQAHQGIGRGLDVHHARVLADRALDIFRVRSIDIGEFEAEVGHHLVEQARGSAVQIISADDVIAGFECVDDGVDCRHAAGEHAGRDSAFQRGKILLQARARGI